MSTASSAGADDDRVAWVEQHKVGWRLGPFSEHVKGRGVVQTGYELVLSGRFDPAGRDDLEALSAGLHEALRALALEALGPAAADVLLCVLPSSRWVVPAEERFMIELQLTVIASPAHPDRLPAPAETRQRIAVLESRLQAMGLHRR
jgi:hypothetical protein